MSHLALDWLGYSPECGIKRDTVRMGLLDGIREVIRLSWLCLDLYVNISFVLILVCKRRIWSLSNGKSGVNAISLTLDAYCYSVSRSIDIL